MKKFITGLITGILLSSTIAFAASYVAQTPTFKVFVNGKEFTSNPPTLVIEGSTYLPLKAIGDALDVPVKWNEELRQVEVGTPPSNNLQTSENLSDKETTNISEIEIKTKKEDWYYKENPNILNMGFVLDQDAYKAIASDGYIGYLYDVKDYPLNPLADYEYVMQNKDEYIIDKSDDELMLIPANLDTSKTVMIQLKNNNETVIVLFKAAD